MQPYLRSKVQGLYIPDGIRQQSPAMKAFLAVTPSSAVRLCTGLGVLPTKVSFPLVFTGSRLGQWILQRDQNKML